MNSPVLMKHPSAVCALLSGSKNTLNGAYLEDIPLQFIGDLIEDEDKTKVSNVYGKVYMRLIARVERD